MTEFRTRSGKVLTDTDFEALAAEAEKGYDVPSREQLREMSEAHVEGLHDEIPQQWCPECGARRAEEFRRKHAT